MKPRRIALGLFVANLGIAFGAGLYESLVELPHWLVGSEGIYQWHSEAVRSANSGLRFWAFVTTGPLTLLSLLNLFLCWKAKGELRQWWIAAVLPTVAERALTFGYFIPTMIHLSNAETSPEVVATALNWERMNVVRHLLNLSALIAALHSFGLSYRSK